MTGLGTRLLLPEGPARAPGREGPPEAAAQNGPQLNPQSFISGNTSCGSGLQRG